jgi:hypothetical protein
MRIRTIKPEFWMHEGLCKYSDFTRLLAIALLNWADDEGYFMANPILIRGQVFPFLDDSKIIPRSLQDLSSVGWIELGTDDQGRSVGRIKNFLKHQRVDKPRPSGIKDSSKFQEPSKNDLGVLQDTSKEEGNGKEEDTEGDKEGNPPNPPRGEWVATALETIWVGCPKLGRERSSRASLEKALKAIPVKHRPTDEELAQSLAAWRESESWKKDGGAFVPGIHRWVTARQWQNIPEAALSPHGRNHAGIQEDIPF